MVSSVLWSKNIINKTKTMIFKTLLKIAMLYGAESWALRYTPSKYIIGATIYMLAECSKEIKKIKKGGIHKLRHTLSGAEGVDEV